MLRMSMARRVRWVLGALAALGALLPVWSGAASPALLNFTPDERLRIAAHGPWPAAAPVDRSNRAEGRPAAVAWGRALFFDARLSAGGQVSCASCHQPAKDFQDARTTPPLLTAGTAQEPGPLRTGHRNTPGLRGTAHERWWGWDGAHDSLWSASLAPLLASAEMGHTTASLAALVRRSADLAAGYQRAYGMPVPADDDRVSVDVAKALAAWQATLRLPRTPFDDFRDALARGDRAAAARYPLAAQRGLRLFVGEARCFFCHSGPTFSNGEFADIGVPFFVPGGVDAGRHQGLLQLQASPYTRLGRHNDAGAADPRAVTTRHVVLEPRHFGEFKVPGLRGLAHTAPYMHNGSLATLQDVVQHYSELNEERLHADGERILRPLKLNAGKRADLEAFLRSLSR
jgi:cytochrome c peroxidase